MSRGLRSAPLLALFALLAASCDGRTASPQVGSETHWIVFADPCSFESCGSVPSSLARSPVVLCTDESGAPAQLEPGQLADCSWMSGVDPNEQAVSAAFCTPSECGAQPAAECPEGTIQSAIAQSCVNENDTGCRWFTQCPQPGPGEPCNTNADCQSGICEGPGCDDLQGRCVPKNSERACTDDVRQRCGCDGITFSGSGSCPDRRYAHDGACEL